MRPQILFLKLYQWSYLYDQHYRAEDHKPDYKLSHSGIICSLAFTLQPSKSTILKGYHSYHIIYIAFNNWSAEINWWKQYHSEALYKHVYNLHEPVL